MPSQSGCLAHLSILYMLLGSKKLHLQEIPDREKHMKLLKEIRWIGDKLKVLAWILMQIPAL